MSEHNPPVADAMRKPPVEDAAITPHMAPPEPHTDVATGAPPGEPIEPDMSEADKQAAPHHPPLDAGEHQSEPDDHAPTHEGQEAVGAVPPPMGDNAAAAAEEQARSHDNEAREAAEKAEADKAKRAEDGVTASQNGDTAFAAYGARIDAAKFEHRNQGHDDTMHLLDDMFAGIQRLEAKLAGD